MVDADLLEPELEGGSWLEVVLELLLLRLTLTTSMQFTIEDLPTSAIPTKAIFMFSSAIPDIDRSRSVSME